MKASKGAALHPALAKALKEKPGLMAAFQRMRPSCHRQYSDWVGMAKDAAAREKRIDGVLEKVRRWGGRNPAKAETVDTYLAALTDDKRPALEKFRTIIKSAAPNAVEGISYRIPVFRHNGKLLVGFAAFKNHCSFFPMSLAIVKAHKAELKSREADKGTIRFAPGKPLPAALIRKIVKARIEENRLRAESKQK